MLIGNLLFHEKNILKNSSPALLIVGSLVTIIALIALVGLGSVIQADTTTNSMGETASTTNPMLSNIMATSSPDGMSATVTWMTNENATSQVGYGAEAATSTGYMKYSVVDVASTTNHSVMLSNLTPNMMYHFQVISRNADLFTTRSSDMTLMMSTSTATSTDTTATTTATSTNTTTSTTTNQTLEQRVSSHEQQVAYLLGVIQNLLGTGGSNTGSGTGTTTPMSGATLTPSSVEVD